MAVRPLAEALAVARDRRERLSGTFIAYVRMLDDEPLAMAAHDLYEYLAFGPHRYPQANWRMTARIYSVVIEEQAFRESCSE